MVFFAVILVVNTPIMKVKHILIMTMAMVRYMSEVKQYIKVTSAEGKLFIFDNLVDNEYVPIILKHEVHQ